MIKEGYTNMKFSLNMLWLALFAVLVAKVSSNALDDYIAMPDPTYTYKVLPDSTRTVKGEYTAFVLNMTSQTWLTGKS